MRHSYFINDSISNLCASIPVQSHFEIVISENNKNKKTKCKRNSYLTKAPNVRCSLVYSPLLMSVFL